MPALEPAETSSVLSSTIAMQELHAGDDFSTFRALNEQWISHHFTLEEQDRQQLEHPEQLLAQGAHIYMALRDSQQVGCMALIPMQPGVLQLSKMAVDPVHRRHGIGRLLVDHAIAEARRLGAAILFLGSNTRLTSAVKLYEAAGFHHVPEDQLPKLAYNRANVFMKLELTLEPPPTT